VSQFIVLIVTDLVTPKATAKQELCSMNQPLFDLNRYYQNAAN